MVGVGQWGEGELARMVVRIKSITPKQLESAAGEVAIVDVRDEEERRAGHIPGSLHLPMSKLPRRLGELSHDRPLVLVCRSGQRSAQVTAYLAERGFDARNLEGGLKAWTRAGLPLSTAEGAPGRVL